MRSIKTVTYWKEIIMRDLNCTNKRVMTLSVSFDGQLLLAAMNNDKQFYVYSTTNSSHMTTLPLPCGSVLDLAWTLRDNIVYIATVFDDLMSVEVVTMSLNGSVIARTVSESILVMYQSLSVSRDGAIYMTVCNQSKNQKSLQHFLYTNQSMKV
jgi:WD40 repeat protein